MKLFFSVNANLSFYSPHRRPQILMGKQLRNSRNTLLLPWRSKREFVPRPSSGLFCSFKIRIDILRAAAFFLFCVLVTTKRKKERVVFRPCMAIAKEFNSDSALKRTTENWRNKQTRSLQLTFIFSLLIRSIIELCGYVRSGQYNKLGLLKITTTKETNLYVDMHFHGNFPGKYRHISPFPN